MSNVHDEVVEVYKGDVSWNLVLSTNKHYFFLQHLLPLYVLAIKARTYISSCHVIYQDGIRQRALTLLFSLEVLIVFHLLGLLLSDHMLCSHRR